MKGRTKGQVEAEVTAALTQFERDHLGRGPKEARSYILGDILLVRLKGILSPAEVQLSREPGGVELIKQVRSRLVEGSAARLKELVEERTGVRVAGMHTDISSSTGERVFIFVLESDLEAALRGEGG